MTRPIVATFLLVGCASGPPMHGPAERNALGAATGSSTATSSEVPADIEIGNGDLSHSPAAIGQPVILVDGPQGGWHIEVSGLVVGLGSVIRLEVWAERTDDGEVVAANSEPAPLLQLAGYDSASRTGWFAGERSFVAADGWTSLCALDGVALNLCARAEDLMDPTLYAEGCTEVVAALDPIDVEPCAAP